VVGQVADTLGVNPNPGEALPPGQGFKEIKDGSITVNGVPITIEGGNAPERYANFLNQVAGIPVGVTGEKLPGGLGIKSGTPGCTSGHTGGNLGLCN
jgi:hypothetical protein